MDTFAFSWVTVNERGEPVAQTPGTARQATEDLGGRVALEMVEIPGGWFGMGSPPGMGFEDETPRHVVRLQPFWLGKFALTQAQWRVVMGKLPPCRTPGERHPVDRVSWNDAQLFCRRLGAKTGRAYRLPSEAEWEYACRAGSMTPFACGETITTQLANYVGEYVYRSEPKGLYRHGSTEVGSFPPNAFGVYDLHGNVWEWCADAWYDDYSGAPQDGSARQRGGAPERVLRGGGWHDPPAHCRSAARLRQAAGEREDYFGFRVALTA